MVRYVPDDVIVRILQHRAAKEPVAGSKRRRPRSKDVEGARVGRTASAARVLV